MGKNRRNKYRILIDLPDYAMKISDYAESKGWKQTSYIYELWRNNKAKDFEIVSFKGINFILPQ